MKSIKTPTTKNDSIAATNKLGLDSFIEDLFGLNIRSFKTIWTSFVRPHQYFRAGLHADWENNFTPSLRLWLGLFALVTALQFFWAGQNTVMNQSIQSTLTTLSEQIISTAQAQGTKIADKPFDASLATNVYFKRQVLIQPIVLIALLMFLSAIYRAWGESYEFVIRQRYIFAILVPGTVIGAICLTASKFIPEHLFGLFSIFQLAIIAGAYFLTAYRGPYKRLENASRLARSIAVAALILIMVLIANAISSLSAIFLALRAGFGG